MNSTIRYIWLTLIDGAQRLLIIFGIMFVGALFTANPALGQSQCSVNTPLRLGPANGDAIDQLGASIALKDNIAFIGAPGRINSAPTLPPYTHTGAVYTARRNGTNWTLDSTMLWAPDGINADGFGLSLALENGWLAVGAPGLSQYGSTDAKGAVYLFQSNADGSTWTYRQKITAPVPAYNEYFGRSVSMSGSNLVVGGYGNSSSAGKAYVFRLSGSTWTFVEALIAPDAAAYDFFAYSVAISGNVILVGSYADDIIGSNSGTVYVYRSSDNGASWEYRQKFWPNSGDTTYNSGSMFGFSLALAGNLAAIGAQGDNEARGSVYIYRDNGLNFLPEAKLAASDGKPVDKLGSSISIDGEKILVGDMNWRNPANASAEQGKAYLFANDGGVWSEKLSLTQPDTYAKDKDYFGSAVALAGGTLIVGAQGENPPAALDSGKAYFFGLSCTGGTGAAPSISASSPPNNFVDALEEKDATSGTLYGVKDISITFSAAVKNASNGAALTVANFERKYFRTGAEITQAPYDLAAGTAPTVTLVSGSGAGPYLLRFSPRIPLGAWTKITAVNVVDAASGTPISSTANKVVLGNLPMDLTQDGKVLGDDINRWLAIKNGTFTPPSPFVSPFLEFMDQKRNGVFAGEDLTRAIQLINGIGTFRVWNGYDIGAKP